MSTEAVESKETQKGGKAVKAAAAVVLAGCLVASLGLNIYQASVQNHKVSQFIDNQLERQAKEEEQENSYQEDGFLVMDKYEIRSTTQISDAYLNGDDSQLSEQDKRTLQMASDVLEEVIQDGMDNYEKELAVYEWMVQNIGQGSGGVISRPGMNSDAFTPYGVLTSRQSVCVGYATTFRLFMNMLGMDCHIVHNDYHSWDLVQLEEGEWYHVDVYSDVHGCLYQNFNMTDDICRNSHNWDDSALPAASSVRYSYAVRAAVELEDLYAVPAAVKQAVDEGTSSVYYKFAAPLDEDEMDAVDLMIIVLSSALDLTGGEYYLAAAWYQDEQEQNILGLFMENYNDEEESMLDLNSPEGQRIIEIIAEAFDIDPDDLGTSDDWNNGEGGAWYEGEDEGAVAVPVG